jgi:uncharacterized protein (DUF433 family)
MIGAHNNSASLDLYAGTDPRNLPSYNILEAAHYLKIPLATLRAWVQGRYYPVGKRGQRKFFQPVIIRPDKNLPLLSFINLIEAHILDAIRYKHNIPLPTVRHTIDYLKRESGSKHPLAEYWFQTDGVSLFIEKYGRIVNASKEGQIEMEEIIRAFLQRVERDPQGAARRLYPFLSKRHPEEPKEEPKLVVIDPLVSFGRPVLAGTGIPTAIIAERFTAGDSIDELAEDYGRKEAEIQEAIRYEFVYNRAA